MLEPAREELLHKVRLWLDERPDRITGTRALHLVIDLLGRSAEVHPADDYIFAYARSQGYYLPPYPMAGSGELKEFLHDEGVADIPAWYRRIGVSAELYPRLYRFELVVVRRKDYMRQALPLEAGWYDRTGKPAPHDDEALRMARYLIDFVCGDDETVRTTLYR